MAIKAAMALARTRYVIDSPRVLRLSGYYKTNEKDSPAAVPNRTPICAGEPPERRAVCDP